MASHILFAAVKTWMIYWWGRWFVLRVLPGSREGVFTQRRKVGFRILIFLFFKCWLRAITAEAQRRGVSPASLRLCGAFFEMSSPDDI
jgi:hypothetical protein